MCQDDGMIQNMGLIPLSFYWFDHKHQQVLCQKTPRRSPPRPRVCRVVTFSSPASWLWSNGLHMGAFKTISCSFTRPHRTLVSSWYQGPTQAMQTTVWFEVEHGGLQTDVIRLQCTQCYMNDC